MRKQGKDPRLSRYEVPSVRRAGKILRILAAQGEALGVSEVSRRLGVPKASAFRVLATLEQEGFVERMDGDCYRIGLSAFEIGTAYSRGTDLEAAFRRIGRRLVTEYNETVQLAMLSGADILYIGKEDSSQPVRLVSRLGSRLPASATALGKSMLACLSEDEINRLWPDGRLVQLTANSHSTVVDLLEDLHKVRQRGFAHDNEEVSVGLQCVAAPIRDGRGHPIAAISISVPSPRMPSERLTELAVAVMGAAEEIARLAVGLGDDWRSGWSGQPAIRAKSDGSGDLGDAA